MTLILGPIRTRMAAFLLVVALLGVGLAASETRAAAADVAHGQQAAVLPAAVTSRSAVTLNVSQSVLRKGERVWIAGKVKVGSKVAPKRTVVIERRSSAGAAWKTATTVKTRSTGKFTVELRPTKTFEYRARVAATTGAGAATSKVKKVKFTSNKRNMNARANLLGSRLGKPTTKIKSLSGAQRKATKVKKVKAVQHRKFANGTLVKVRTSKTRTWLVSDKIEQVYRAAGGPTGKYGVPVQDAKCGLIEQGCIQRFSKGTIYSNKSKTKATGAVVTGRKGEVIAAARSQVGYKYHYSNSSVQHTKFNSFMGNTKAWCSFFTSWASAASGNGTLIPKSKSFTTFKADVNRTMKTGHTPKVGALVFFNTYAPAGVPTHAGIVASISGSTIRVIDGNTVGNLPPNHRGVLERDWPKSRALFYAYPNY